MLSGNIWSIFPFLGFNTLFGRRRRHAVFFCVALIYGTSAVAAPVATHSRRDTLHTIRIAYYLSISAINKYTNSLCILSTGLQE